MEKKRKKIYLPKNKPETVDIPEFKYFTIEGEGNPNSDAFPEYIGVLYSLSYAVKMSYKKGIEPDGYFDYTVYPIEGVWDIKEDAKKNFTGTIKIMEDFAIAQGLKRFSKIHKEIYLNDARKTAPEKLKTVLRFQAAKHGK